MDKQQGDCGSTSFWEVVAAAGKVLLVIRKAGCIAIITLMECLDMPAPHHWQLGDVGHYVTGTFP